MPPFTTTPKLLTVKEVAQRFRCDQHHVLWWIKSGELVGIDVSKKRGGRPRWRINSASLIEFEAARSADPYKVSHKRKHRRKTRQASNVIDFYPN